MVLDKRKGDIFESSLMSSITKFPREEETRVSRKKSDNKGR
jgi:hypothetical protein